MTSTPLSQSKVWMCLYISRGCNLLPRGRSLASSLSFILRNVLQAKSQPNTLATKQVALEAKEHARAKDFVSDWWMLFSGAGRSGADAALDQFFSHCWENDEGEDDPHLHHAATELTLWCALCQTFVMIEPLLLFLQDCSLRCLEITPILLDVVTPGISDERRGAPASLLLWNKYIHINQNQSTHLLFSTMNKA